MKKQIIFTNLLLTLVCSLILSTNASAQVKTWGSNDSGQLGDGTTTNRPSPTNINSLTDIIDIHGGGGGFGGGHTLAVKAGGTVMAWGLNDYGQLGNGTTNTTGCKCNPTPGAVPGLTNVIAVSGGGAQSLALKADGTVWAWGANENAQLGDATTTNRLTPVKVGVGVSGFNSIIAIDAGGRHNLALKSDGTVWAWGDNNSGQIGDGTLTDLVLVVQITSLSNNILAVSAGNSHSMALSKTGQIYVWGQNDSGQLGNGTASGYAVAPTLNTNISGVAQIQAGGFHNVAFKTDGTVWAWGNNALGQIGNGTAASISGCQCVMAPTQSSITNVIAIRAETGSHALARKKKRYHLGVGS